MNQQKDVFLFNFKKHLSMLTTILTSKDNYSLNCLFEILPNKT